MRFKIIKKKDKKRDYSYFIYESKNEFDAMNEFIHDFNLPDPAYNCLADEWVIGNQIFIIEEV